MKVVLSIKPAFAYKIFDGTKIFEFRKTIFKSNEVKTVIVYASSPVKKVIGEFEIEKIIFHDIDTLWSLTKHHSGITEDYYYKYFIDKTVGYAIQVKVARIYECPKCLWTEYNLVPPQSFAYIIS